MKRTYLGNADPAAIEQLYQNYLLDPFSVDETWKTFFEGFDFARKNFDDVATVKPQPPAASAGNAQLEKEFNVLRLINDYRVRGHLFTDTNPVRERRKYFPTLAIENFGLTEQDLTTVFQAGHEIGIGAAKLSDIISHLHDTYCRSVGAEYKYIRQPDVVKWFEQKMESCKNSAQFSISDKRKILQKLNQAVAFENFLHVKFAGQKRFSLEGAETTIPALDAIIEFGSNQGIKEFVIGMSHRGRLNVLANILNKSYEDIFTEFEGKEFDDNAFDGDVKYHLGFSSDVTTHRGNNVHLSLTPNPSHLEAVDAVVQGIVRAKIDAQGGTVDDIAPILIHGDAAVAAQGVVYEVIQMSLLKGYSTGGTIHLVINNQVGFTTNYIDARSSTYCTDIAKVTLSPVFHVNGDDVEALIYTIRLAVEYRQKFHRDVFVDILCYRKYGHNEGDEPRFTQPLLYKAIAAHANPREIYMQKLIAQGEVEANLVKETEKEFKSMLEDKLSIAKKTEKTKVVKFKEGSWNALRFSKSNDFDDSPETKVDKKTLLTIAEKITSLPGDKKFFSKITRLFNDRKEMLKGAGRLDWAMGELLAYGTLLHEGFPVRLSGQDSERGTFSHRHAVLRVEDSEEQYTPLNHISEKQAPFYIYNSLLSEYGVLGFDYGYAFTSPNSLVLWEAQFGDFGNGAQIIIDQYLSSAEDKWKRMNGIVLLLPHGYEGQGAEHSSARMERFLALCAEYNMVVANITSPANYFHLLRRQLKWSFRKPLVVMTPKSLLRHPLCVSALNEFTDARFSEVIDDATAEAEKVSKLILCSGKVYYDLLQQRNAEKINDVAILRLEQLYPFPQKQLNVLLKKYKKAERIWLQEEPSNMGAWSFIKRMMPDEDIKLIARPASASPATGSHDAHEKEQELLLQKAFETAKILNEENN
jgi:2-oxoglutarate dehydrogenase E1 component